MKMKLEGTINNEGIAQSINDINLFLQRSGIDEKLCLATRLILEEVMLVYQANMDEEKNFEIHLKKNKDEIRCSFIVCGNCVDPELSDNMIIQRVQESVYFPMPEWNYKDGRNCVILSIPLYNTTLKNLKFVWKYVQSCRGPFYIAVGAQLLSLILNIVIPILSAQIIVAYTNSAVEQIMRMGIIIIAVDLFTDIAKFFCSTRYNMVYNKVVSGIEYDLANSTLGIKNSCIEEKGSGLFIRRLTVDTETLASGFNTLADLVFQMVTNIGILVAMLIVSPLIFAVVVILLGVQIYIEVLRTQRMTKDDRLFRREHERFSGLASEMVRGVADIKMLNAEKSFEKEMLKSIQVSNDSQMNMILTAWRYKLGRWGIMDISKLVVICLLGVGIGSGRIAPATALVLFNYNTLIVDGNAVLLLGQLLEFLKSFNLSTERICAVLNSPEFPKDQFGTIHLDSVRGAIKFEHVKYCYETDDFRFKKRVILNDMSFEIPAGSTVALVGRSGCGKSTIFRLMCRLSDATGGTIYLDGTDIKELDKESLRGNVAVISQNPYIYHMTIRKNLQIAKPDMTDEEMYEVCRIACIADDIEKMPQKYDSIIGEGGVNLSGGQRQRLAIARGLLRNPAVLLMDEATSALDNVTQTEIVKELNRVRNNQTVVMIAHRLSTVINSDIIMFIEEGRVLDKGTHEELLERCSAYRELYDGVDGSFCPEPNGVFCP